ncbi:phosphoketolase family protein [Brooklawnia propionicigenes]|uniref:Phosphoketolase family protein n=1 Tax=Brooklawnia propionicigenes TaxID=3041175 RepID=A0AAN0K7N3_9ACTN|nr:hypothetical protein [Brooklawnia sp. SH051]BEH03136.1 phosphoketolase family protein [Brooklawnia sp. SH051]
MSSITDFWRAANFLSLSLLYLNRPVLAPSTLDPESVKPRIFGHWGVCPSINAVYAHLNDLCRRTERQVNLVVGPGHAGPALAACTFLDDSLHRAYPQFSRDLDGLAALLASYSTEDGFSTEISMEYPNVDYVGGELGNALAFAQGAVLGSPERIVVAMVGDGELETAAGHSSWQGFDYLHPAHDGIVIPVINANGFRMGSRSLWSLRSRDRQRSLLAGYGIVPIFVGADHQELADAFDQALDRAHTGHGSWPAIVLETPKGWTGPGHLNGEAFLGTRHAHKPLLKSPRTDPHQLEELRSWLASYAPETLFTAAGEPAPGVLACLPSGDSGIRPLRVSIPSVPGDTATRPSDHDTAFAALRDVAMSAVQDDASVYLIGPDELESNTFLGAGHSTPLRHGFTTDPGFAPDSRVMEILNESVCFDWSWGLAASNRRPIFVSYEAFSPIFASQADQFLKQIRAGSQVPHRTAAPGVTLVLTSLGWYNTPTHHNPSFVDSLVSRVASPELAVYMPVQPSSAAAYMREALCSTDRLSVLVASKHGLGLLAKQPSPGLHQEPETLTGWTTLAEASATAGPSVCFVAVGDLMAEVATYVVPHVATKTGRHTNAVAIEDLSMLGHAHHPGWESLLPRLEHSHHVLWLYGGRPTAIKPHLADLGLLTGATVLGFQDNDQAPSGLPRLRVNGLDPETVVALAVSLAEGTPQ